jgi:DNA repair photolyase
MKKTDPHIIKESTDAASIAPQKDEGEMIIQEAFQKLKEIFHRHFHEAMLEAGSYLMDIFYAGEFKRVFEKNPVNKGALHRLYSKLNQSADDVPSRGWLYNAVMLAAHEKYFQIKNFQTFGNLGHSQKLLLLNIPDFPKKQEIAQVAFERKFSVRDLKDYIKNDEQVSEDRFFNFNLLDLPPKEMLMLEDIDTLEKLRLDAELKVTNYTKELTGYKKATKKLTAAIEEKKPTQIESRNAIKNNEWTLSRNNVNFSTGCSNNCLYCYGRYMPYANKLSRDAIAKGKEFKWGEAKIRKKDVDKSQSLRSGRVGFPTSHDITPGNLNDYLTVLGKLLKAGNEVMIISKPNLECIKSICQAASFFKDKILFRFTITAKSADTLKFWEPNAPTYEERMHALKQAFDNGFQTSVSMEPMLEFSKVPEMVEEMMPYITNALWFGKMNHIKTFNTPDENLKEELKKVEEGHSDENIKFLYSLYKDNAKIKWKLAFKELLGIPLPPAPGMDM